MSKVRRPYIEGLKVAMRLEAVLGPSCLRIEIAGSIRRRSATVGDIELVAIPKPRISQDLFGAVMEEKSALDIHLEKFPEIYQMIKSGARMKQFIYEGLSVDLFTTDVDRWGSTFTLRTGCADFSKWLVTSRTDGGAKRVDRRVRDGLVWAIGESEPLHTPEELDFFNALGVPWVPLEKRYKGWWHENMDLWKPETRMEEPAYE